ncbi:MAG: ribosome maturation factor RimP [Lachnospiraceae bacterium]|nr:ribosome maturation factor RimP [Lachnospiraceae bacterium]
MAEGKGKKTNIAERAEEMLVPIAETCGVEIYDVEYVKEAGEQYLRAYIDKRPDGVTIDDCEAVSRAFSDALDADDFIPDAYILEVSSPGLGRQLKKDRHLARSIGEEVEIKTFREIDGTKLFEGVLEAFDKETVTIRAGDDGGEKTLLRKDIAVIRLALDF